MDTESPTENMDSKPKSRRGGPRPGSGRKKGQLSPQTIERAAVLKAFRDRVMKNADNLFNAQLDLAIGEKYLMVKHTEGTGNKRHTWTEIVTDPQVIIDYLDGELENTDDEYYYMTTKPANNMSIDSLLDRTFGKAQQSVKLHDDRPDPTVLLLERFGLMKENKGGDAGEVNTAPDETS